VNRLKGFSRALATTMVMLMVLSLAAPALAAEIGGTKETYIGGDPANTGDKLYVVGETIYYVMTVENPDTNTRINTMTRIWDTLPDGTVIDFLDPGETLVMMPGEVATFLAEYLVKPEDVGLLENTFEAEGFDNATPAPDSLRVLITKNALVVDPDISITKTVSHETSKVGDVVNYTITVTNTGDYPLENMVVTDALLGGDITTEFAFDASLAPGASKTAVIPHTILEADLTEGMLLNTVTVNAHALDYPAITVSDEDQATVAMVNPDFTITKVADTPVSKTGDTINYTVTVTNTGDVNMEFLVTDSLVGQLFDGVINAGDNRVFNYAYVVKIEDYPGPLTNTATAVATLGWLNLDNVYTKTADVDTRLVTPGIDITKTVNPVQAAIGEEVTYTIRVTNTGDYALENMAVNDTMFGNITAQFGFDATLAVGAWKEITIPYTILAADYPGPLVNTADVYANPVGLPNDITDEDSATLTIIINPDISITKDVSHTTSKVGDIVTYTIVVTNTGDIALENMVVTDALLGGNITSEFGFDATLAPGASKTAVIPYTVLAGDIEDDLLLNTARVDAHALGLPAVTVWDEDDARVLMVNPDFTITKVADTPVSKTGDTINYTVTVTNTGDVNMEFLVTDSLVGQLFDGVINAGDNRVFNYAYVVKIEDYPGPLTNTATAVATLGWLNLDNVYTKTADVDTRLVTPGIDITKTVNPVQAAIGEEVTYTIRVTNTGDYALENMAVNDTMFGNITAQFGFDATLAVGAWKEITIPYTILAADYPGPLVNTADVYANPVGLPNDITDEDSATLTIIINPDISITKDVSHTTSKVGDVVTYTIVVTNTGDIALENMVVTDALLGGNITSEFGFDATLAPGASKTAVIPYTVLAGDIENGALLNTARVDAHALGLPAVTVWDEDDARVAMVNPNFTITKVADTPVSKTGDTINYTVTVANTGDVDMEFLVTDSMHGVLFDGIIEAGMNKVFNYAHVVQAGDYPGPINNVVEAVATLEWLDLDNVYTKTAEVDVQLVTPAVTISKTVDPVEAYIGDTVTYTIRVTNTGDWALENMVVNDTMFGNITAQFGFDATLAVGAWKEITIPYTIQSTDYPGPRVNTADVYANPVGLPNAITDEDSAYVTVLLRMCYMDETAWAYGAQYANANWDYVNNRFWGWTNGPLTEGDYVFDIYAAAGQNDLSKGTLVGELLVSYHGGTVTVTYTMFDENYLSEVHLWVGSTPLPEVKQGKKTSYTNAPGRFPYSGSAGFVPGSNQTEWTWTGTGFTGPIYVAAHSVVQIAYPCPDQFE
jgi:uncharacterized repeat protein (TIGR01451 family)